MRKLKTLFIFLLLMVVSSIISCTSSPTKENGSVGNLTSPTTTSTVPTETTTMPPPTTEPNYPVTGSLELSRLPLPGEETEVMFSINVVRAWEGIWQIVEATSDTLADSKAWITVLWMGIDGRYSETRQYTEIPVEEIAVSGDTSWKGNALENRSIELKSTIRLPKEGKWIIKGSFTGDNWGKPLDYSQQIVVADGTAVPYNDLLSSPLAYLDDLEYTYYILPPDEQNPVLVEVDMTHPPLAGEEVSTMLSVLSPFYDIEDFKIKVQFVKRTGDDEDIEIIMVPADDVIVSSELGWETDGFNRAVSTIDLVKNETRELSYIIRFPEPGEWIVDISGRCFIPDTGSFFSPDDGIKLTITESKAYYGWEKK
jgi:hypothetical protein